jgi:large subunit ribosomal protein L1
VNKDQFVTALQKMRTDSRKRKFTQSIELMLNFKSLDYKKRDNQIDVRVKLPHATKKGSGKTLLFAKTKAFVDQVTERVTKVIMEDKIAKLGKKEVASILNDYDLLLAEGPVMLTVGKYLGQQLAPKGRMPNPVQPTIQSMNEAMKELGGAVRISNKKGKPAPQVQLIIGDEDMKDEELAENGVAVVAEITNVLPNKVQNLKSVMVKESMGPAIKVGVKE